jgi:hypothetical protein
MKPNSKPLALVFVGLCIPVLSYGQTKTSYGDDPMQYGELYLPAGEGPFPVVTFLEI